MTDKELADWTSEELAEYISSETSKIFGVSPLVLDEVALRLLRELPDPAPSEPEYGWANLSRDLGIAMAISSLRNEELQIAGVVGTCVRLMREKGWDTTRVRNPEQNRWTWATSNSQRPETVMGSCGPAPSEPAAWRDMLKHAGVIQ
jgi:hypothetical protein